MSPTNGPGSDQRFRNMVEQPRHEKYVFWNSSIARATFTLEKLPCSNQRHQRGKFHRQGMLWEKVAQQKRIHQASQMIR